METLPIDCIQRITQYIRFPISYFFQYSQQSPSIKLLFGKKNHNTFLLWTLFYFSNEYCSIPSFASTLQLVSNFGALVHLVFFFKINNENETNTFSHLLQHPSIAKQIIKLKISFKNGSLPKQVVFNTVFSNLQSVHLFYTSNEQNNIFASSLLLQCIHLKRLSGIVPIQQVLENETLRQQMFQLEKLNCINTSLEQTKKLVQILPTTWQAKNLSIKNFHWSNYPSFSKVSQLSSYLHETLGRKLVLSNSDVSKVTHMRCFNNAIQMEGSTFFVKEFFGLQCELEWNSWAAFTHLSNLILLNCRVASFDGFESLQQLHSLEYRYTSLSLILISKLKQLTSLQHLHISSIERETEESMLVGKELQNYLESSTLNVLHVSVPHCYALSILQSNSTLQILSTTQLSNCDASNLSKFTNSTLQMLILEGSWKNASKILKQCKGVKVVGLVRVNVELIAHIHKKYPQLLIAVREVQNLNLKDHQVVHLDFKIFELHKQVPKLMDLLYFAPLIAQ